MGFDAFVSKSENTPWLKQMPGNYLVSHICIYIFHTYLTSRVGGREKGKKQGALPCTGSLPGAPPISTLEDMSMPPCGTWWCLRYTPSQGTKAYFPRKIEGSISLGFNSNVLLHETQHLHNL